ncbi:hypothetical protein GCM10017161_38090 [Thalassotalea marina]|uniref:Intradiol ring-cleavage dioxygenases domain-containing protein n=2 Tax=Thalassotalea marina TaxID=1673741 RepID=A0A919BRE3_9GAMM|nr:hypothetical protein GCM10017161_38090 [Thalassotalea marina]
MRTTCLLISTLLTFTAIADANELVIGGPCQGCENVFVNMPKKIKSDSRISPTEEQGEPLKITGNVFTQEGKPAPNIIVYAYQTDATGKYPKSDTFHGKLRGWAKTDLSGAYSFNSIRPVAYPNGREPQHIHFHVIEPNRGTYYIDDITFSDDPLLSADKKSKTLCRGGCGLSEPKKNKAGVWLVTRDIILGENIPGYH